VAVQTDLDRLQVAWHNLQRQVNQTLPNTTNHLAYVRGKINPNQAGQPPKPS
jgi:hypothetical protein